MEEVLYYMILFRQSYSYVLHKNTGSVLIPVATPTPLPATTDVPPPTQTVVIFVVVDIGFLLIGKPYSLICQDSGNVVDTYQLYDYNNGADSFIPNLHVGKIRGGGYQRQSLLLFTTTTTTIVAHESVFQTTPANMDMKCELGKAWLGWSTYYLVTFSDIARRARFQCEPRIQMYPVQVLSA